MSMFIDTAHLGGIPPQTRAGRDLLRSLFFGFFGFRAFFCFERSKRGGESSTTASVNCSHLLPTTLFVRFSVPEFSPFLGFGSRGFLTKIFCDSFLFVVLFWYFSWSVLSVSSSTILCLNVQFDMGARSARRWTRPHVSSSPSTLTRYNTRQNVSTFIWQDIQCFS